MAGIRKREWKTKKGVKKFCYEVTYYINGKLHTKSGYSTKEKAQLAISDLKENFNENMPFKKLADSYINTHCEINNCKKSTIDLYNSYLNNHTLKINDVKLKDIKLRNLNQVILDMKEKNLKNKTINDIMTFISAIFNYGINDEIIGKNPCRKLRPQKNQKNEMKFLTTEQINVLLKTCEQLNTKFYPLLYTAIFTGIRRGELLALEWSDIDFGNKKINVNKTIYRGTVTDPKTYSSNRKVDMSDGLVKVLKQHKKNRSELSKIVFCNTFGKYQHAWDMVSKQFKPILNECNLSVRFHDLRHTYASLLLSKNVPIKYIQTQLGHSDCRITLNRYSHLMPEINERAINILDGVINKSEHKMSIKN